MECPFVTGDKVVCIEEFTEEDRAKIGIHGPVLDERYTIHRVAMGLCRCCMSLHPFVAVCEISGPLACFDYQMFRKLLTIDDFKSTEIDAPVDRIKEPELI